MESQTVKKVPNLHKAQIQLLLNLYKLKNKKRKSLLNSNPVNIGLDSSRRHVITETESVTGSVVVVANNNQCTMTTINKDPKEDKDKAKITMDNISKLIFSCTKFRTTIIEIE